MKVDDMDLKESMEGHEKIWREEKEGINVIYTITSFF